MQHTFQIKSSNLNNNFIESVREMFGDKELKIVVEDVERNTVVSQKELYKKSLSVIDRFKNVTVDSNLDLAALANEVNL